MSDTSDLTTNEIGPSGKIAAGLLLIFFTLLPIWIIVSYWPDRLPRPDEPVKPLYLNKLYHVRLVCIPKNEWESDTFYLRAAHPALVNDTIRKSADSARRDSTIGANDSIDSLLNKTPLQHGRSFYLANELIDLNSLILILVIAAGFLGNIIHIATSFTTFVGANKFKRSWILWYGVKPFTAAALALGLYFVFRGGFMNYSADPSSANLYGILTISILTGLFTDRATLKLGEIFDVVFSVKKDLKNDDPRPDKLNSDAIKIVSAEPDKLVKDQENIITLNGQNLDKQPLVFKINNEAIAANNITTTAATIKIKYTIPAEQADKTEFKLQALGKNGKALFEKTFTV